MAQLKRWESPRQRGRNHKGKGGSARQRQKMKQRQLWRQRLQQPDPSDKTLTIESKREVNLSLFLCISSVLSAKSFRHNKVTEGSVVRTSRSLVHKFSL